MFTGIIEEVGRVEAIRPGTRSLQLTIAARRVLEGARVGDSIAVSGVCLTVTGLSPAPELSAAPGWFTADVVFETLNRTTLGDLRPGDPVNLERSMAADGRFGGHIVQGHVDAVGRIAAVTPEESGRRVTIGAPGEIMRYLVEKGSVAVDGVSLTVAAVRGSTFDIAAIPHTLTHTTLGQRQAGDPVNLEVDILAKYVKRLLRSQSQ